MTTSDVVNAIACIGTLVAAFYGALGYHRYQNKSTVADREPQLRFRQGIASLSFLALLAWGAAGFDFYDRHFLSVQIPDAIIGNYGTDSPNTFHAIVQFREWENYKNYKAILIVRNAFIDRDRMTDDWIAKSNQYTVDRQVIALSASNNIGKMKFAPNLMNMIEFNLIVVPQEIVPDRIQSLNDVSKLGGKILATAAQGISLGGPVDTQSNPGK